LNSGDGTSAGAVLIGDLSQKSPENQRVRVVTNPFGSTVFFKEFRVDFVAQLLGDIEHGTFANCATSGDEKVLIVTDCPSK